MDSLNPAELFVPEMRSLMRAKDLIGLKEVVLELNPIDLAGVFSVFAPEEQVLLLRLLDRRRAQVVFEELELLQQEYILHHLDDEHLVPLVESLAPKTVKRLVHKMPGTAVRRMEKHLRQGQVDELRTTEQYPAESVGSLMQRQVVSLRPDMSIRGAIEVVRVKLRIRDDHPFFALYVTNELGQPVGALTPRTLLAAPEESRLSEIMTPVAAIRLPGSMDREEAARLFSRYKLLSAPVVDDKNLFIGVVTADQMLRVAQKEATEDIQKLGGVESLDEPYFKISLRRMVQRRGTWLCVLFLGEMLTATAMAFFEKEIAKAVVLALFIPLIISSGGNSGSQAATLVVRAMALREITFRDWWRVMRREFAAGLSLGLLLGTIGFLRIFLWSQFSDIYGPHYALVAATVGVALVLIVLWGSLAGSMLPMVLKKVGLDPAVVSAPFVATLVDVTGLVIYFVTGLVLLRGTLL